MHKIIYAYEIGSIMYSIMCSKPDVWYALSTTRRYQHDPNDGHWVVIKNIINYLKKKYSLLAYGFH